MTVEESGGLIGTVVEGGFVQASMERSFFPEDFQGKLPADFNPPSVTPQLNGVGRDDWKPRAAMRYLDVQDSST